MEEENISPIPTPVDVKGFQQKPSPTIPDAPIKQKNPRRVAAGKKLAEYNKRQKEQLNELLRREAEREQQPEIEEQETPVKKTNYTPIYFTISILIAGIGYYAYTNYKPQAKTAPVKIEQKPSHTWE